MLKGIRVALSLAMLSPPDVEMCLIRDLQIERWDYIYTFLK